MPHATKTARVYWPPIIEATIPPIDAQQRNAVSVNRRIGTTPIGAALACENSAPAEDANIQKNVTAPKNWSIEN
jgi:hypothetical protein